MSASTPRLAGGCDGTAQLRAGPTGACCEPQRQRSAASMGGDHRVPAEASAVRQGVPGGVVVRLPQANRQGIVDAKAKSLDGGEQRFTPVRLRRDGRPTSGVCRAGACVGAAAIGILRVSVSRQDGVQPPAHHERASRFKPHSPSRTAARSSLPCGDFRSIGHRPLAQHDRALRLHDHHAAQHLRRHARVFERDQSALALPGS